MHGILVAYLLVCFIQVIAFTAGFSAPVELKDGKKVTKHHF